MKQVLKILHLCFLTFNPLSISIGVLIILSFIFFLFRPLYEGALKLITFLSERYEKRKQLWRERRERCSTLREQTRLYNDQLRELRSLSKGRLCDINLLLNETFSCEDFLSPKSLGRKKFIDKIVDEGKKLRTISYNDFYLNIDNHDEVEMGGTEFLKFTARHIGRCNLQVNGNNFNINITSLEDNSFIDTAIKMLKEAAVRDEQKQSLLEQEAPYLSDIRVLNDGSVLFSYLPPISKLENLTHWLKFIETKQKLLNNNFQKVEIDTTSFSCEQQRVQNFRTEDKEYNKVYLLNTEFFYPSLEREKFLVYSLLETNKIVQSSFDEEGDTTQKETIKAMNLHIYFTKDYDFAHRQVPSDLAMNFYIQRDKTIKKLKENNYEFDIFK